MGSQQINQTAQCPCGHSQFTLKGKPLMRLYCHCLICQKFNEAEYADVTIFRSEDVDLKDEQTVEFQKYKMPPAVNRGKCKQCHLPALENLRLPGLPALTIIPSSNIPHGNYLPQPSSHIFYHRRINNSDDDLPKYNGYLTSQAALIAKLIPDLIKRKLFN